MSNNSWTRSTAPNVAQTQQATEQDLFTSFLRLTTMSNSFCFPFCLWRYSGIVEMKKTTHWDASIRCCDRAGRALAPSLFHGIRVKYNDYLIPDSCIPRSWQPLQGQRYQLLAGPLHFNTSYCSVLLAVLFSTICTIQRNRYDENHSARYQ